MKIVESCVPQTKAGWTLETIVTTIFISAEFSWETVYAGGVCLCTGTASTSTGLVTSAALF